MESQTLEEIKVELQELRRLYQTLVDKLVPIDEAQEDEVAATALWLCSDAARSVNGHALAISGGEV